MCLLTVGGDDAAVWPRDAAVRLPMCSADRTGLRAHEKVKDEAGFRHSTLEVLSKNLKTLFFSTFIFIFCVDPERNEAGKPA